MVQDHDPIARANPLENSRRDISISLSASNCDPAAWEKAEAIFDKATLDLRHAVGGPIWPTAEHDGSCPVSGSLYVSGSVEPHVMGHTKGASEVAESAYGQNEQSS